MKSKVCTMGLGLAAYALASAAWAGGPDSGWRAISSDYIALTHLEDPVVAGQRGDAAALRRWPDVSPEAEAAIKARLLDLTERLKTLPEAGLSADEAFSRKILQRQIDLQLESLGFDEDRLPFQNGEGFYTLPETTATTLRLANAEAAEAWLARLAALPDYFDANIKNMRRGVATHFTQTQLVVKSAIAVTKGLSRQPAAESALLAPFDTLPPNFSPERRAALRAEAVRLIAEKVRPAQARLAAYLKDDYLPHARAALGARALPDGERYYAYLVRRYTTTTLTPDAVHSLGVREVARIRAKMEAAIAESGFKGDFRQFQQFLLHDPQFYVPDAQTYVEKIDEIAKRTDYLLPRYFGRLPRLTYGVRAKPAGSESTSDGYLLGSPENGVAGSVVYSASSAAKSPLYSLPAWFLHEGVPGHHLQIALSQENFDAPEYRRNDDVTAFVEGWALYAEDLGEEMGIYRTPYERFGRLSMEMWRACRLVIDTGVHWQGWSRDQAAQCLKDNTAMSDGAIYREVDRYIGWPGQALGYKIGELKILEARRRAEAALGAKFDVRAFHDAVLGQGAMPMDLLDQTVDAWIAARKAGGS